jgi:hypothetical protein
MKQEGEERMGRGRKRDDGGGWTTAHLEDFEVGAGEMAFEEFSRRGKHRCWSVHGADSIWEGPRMCSCNLYWRCRSGVTVR